MSSIYLFIFFQTQVFSIMVLSPCPLTIVTSSIFEILRTKMLTRTIAGPSEQQKIEMFAFIVLIYFVPIIIANHCVLWQQFVCYIYIFDLTLLFSHLSILKVTYKRCVNGRYYLQLDLFQSSGLKSYINKNRCTII